MLRNILLVLVAFTLVVGATAASAQALNWSFSAASVNSAETEEDIDQWDEDIINITVAEPGVLHVDAEGTDIKGQSGSEDLCGGGSWSLSSGWFGATDRGISIPVRAGDYVMKLNPHGTTTVNYRVRATLLDLCVGESGDDHGDIPVCATELCSGTGQSGSLGSYTNPDYDYFTFVVSSTATVDVYSSGSTDVAGDLFDDRGALLASDGESTTNFSISEVLKEGRYFVRVRPVGSATGSYSVTYE